MKTKLILLSALLSAAALAFTLTAHAAIPHLMNYQGKATDKAGAPLNGTYNLKFRIYNTETAGTPKWTETQSNIPISNGIFQVQLGSVTPLNLPFDESYWISIEINTDGEMSPRTRLASVGYAYMAETSNTNVMPVGSVVQVVNYSRSDAVACNTKIPIDDTIPTWAEGVSVLTLAITPKSATNILRIDVSVLFANSGAGYRTMAALFKNGNGIDSAIAVSGQSTSEAALIGNIYFTHFVVAGSTDAATYAVRVGTNSINSNCTVNGNGLGARFFGGVASSSITITEIKG